MEKIFSNYKINKHIDRKGVNLLIKHIKRRTKISSYIVFSALNSSGEHINENWNLKRDRAGKQRFVSSNQKSDFLKLSTNFKTSILNYLTVSNTIIVILICNMKQKIDNKKLIKEMWGFKIEKNKNETIFSQITSEDIYTYSTTNAYTGKSIPAKKELVYCGPDGKICGWDMV